ncbi:MAG: helix-turn-helix domain-containing protein [Oscillospiraceae bacterium]
MEKLNFIIAKNLSELRRKNKLTQLEVAEKLNYSDKAVSKWEQGESLPGIEVLYACQALRREYGLYCR